MERRCIALGVIYSVHSGGKAKGRMLSWYDMKAKLIFSRMWEGRGSLNCFFIHNLSNIVLNRFYLSPPLAIFFLIRHLPPSGVCIIYRKVITYMRQPPTALVVIRETASHDGPMGQSFRLLIFTRADRPDSCKMFSDLPTISELSPPLPPKPHILFPHICHVKLTPASPEGSQTAWLQELMHVIQIIISIIKVFDNAIDCDCKV